jgi:oxazoline/thiazoline synthase
VQTQGAVRFAPDVSVWRIPGEGLLLEGRDGASVVAGEVAAELALLVDGRQTAGEIASQLAQLASRAEVFYALLELESLGFLDSGDAAAGGEPATGVAGSAPRTGVAGGPPITAAPGDSSATIAGAAPPRFVLASDHLAPELAAVNAAALEAGDRWLLVSASAHELWIGPLFVPGATACWECMRHRVAANRATLTALRESARLVHAPSAGVLAREASRASAMAEAHWPALTGRIMRVGRTGTTVHQVHRRPQCAACGDPTVISRGIARPLATSLGQEHEPPTIDELAAQLVDPTAGILAQLEPLGSAESVVKVYVTGASPLPVPRGIAGARRHLRSQCAGKGRTAAQARASAIGEAVERYALVAQGDEPRHRATMRELGDAAIHPNDCMLFSRNQFACRDITNPGADPTALVPRPLPVDEAVEWSPVWSVTRQRQRWIPTSYLFIDRSRRSPESVCVAESNGVAAGSSVADALLGALLELAERDAVAIWWYNRLSRPGFSVAPQSALLVATPDGNPHPVNLFGAALASELESKGRELWLLDLTSDLGIPVYGAISRRTKSAVEEILFGFGAHMDGTIAVERALTELGQVLAGVESIAGDGSLDGVMGRWLSEATLGSQPFLAPAKGLAWNAPRNAAPGEADPETAVARLIRLLDDRGLEVLTADMTRPDVAMPVVRALVPGLRHFWPRFAPGRLYNVPVEMGWLTLPRGEDELNPIPFFL